MKYIFVLMLIVGMACEGLAETNDNTSRGGWRNGVYSVPVSSAMMRYLIDEIQRIKAMDNAAIIESHINESVE